MSCFSVGLGNECPFLHLTMAKQSTSSPVGVNVNPETAGFGFPHTFAERSSEFCNWTTVVKIVAAAGLESRLSACS